MKNTAKISKALNEAIYKKAVGYETDEIVEEYVYDEFGDLKLNKKKVTKKYVSPDLQSVKMLLDKLKGRENRYKNYSDEQLLEEKQKLLEKLSQLKN